jgi:hypothetical protein
MTIFVDTDIVMFVHAELSRTGFGMFLLKPQCKLSCEASGFLPLLLDLQEVGWHIDRSFRLWLRLQLVIRDPITTAPRET